MAWCDRRHWLNSCDAFIRARCVGLVSSFLSPFLPLLISFFPCYRLAAKTVTNMSFFLTMTTQTLMRMDDLLSTLLAFIQPWSYKANASSTEDDVFCLVIMRYDGKTLSGKPVGLFSPFPRSVLSPDVGARSLRSQFDEPVYHFLIPHKDPQVCAVLHLTAHLHRLFDILQIHVDSRWTNGEEWIWSIPRTWRMVRSLPPSSASLTD